MPPLLTLQSFAETYFPGDLTPTVDGYAGTCPVCRTDSALTIRDLFGRVAVGCLTADCPGTFADALALTEPQWLTLLDTVQTPSTGSAPAVAGKSGDGRLSADDVVTWIESNYRLGRSTDGLPFAVPTYPGSNRIAREVRSIRSDVLRRFREDRKARTGKGVVIGPETMTSALGLVAALAEDAEEHPEPVSLRAAQIGNDRVVLDLGLTSGRLVDVTPAGWSVKDPSDAMPLFRRSAAVQPLPEPTSGGSLDSLRDLLGLEADDRRWLIVRGWLVASLFSEIPRPLLWATGSQGSGKSVRTRMILSVIEPTDSLGKEPGRNERDDSTAALGRYLVSYDNITSVSQNTSDWICRLVTGVTDDRRQLYSDGDLRPMTYRRSGVATSITLPPGLGADALERIALLALDRVPDDDRRGEAELWTGYRAAHAEILGAVLTDIVLVLRNLEAVKREKRPRPRMADYANILLALDRGLGLPDDAGHLAAYVGAVDESLAERALDDPFTAAVLALVEQSKGQWSGTATELKQKLDLIAVGQNTDLPKWWPTNGRAAANQCVRAQEALRHAGVIYNRRRSNGSRLVELTGTMPLLTVPVTGTEMPPIDPDNAAGQPPSRDGRVDRDDGPGPERPSPLCAPDEKEEEGTQRYPLRLGTRATVPIDPSVPGPITAPSLEELSL